MSSFIIGLTGGLASGKTTVLRFFEKLGIKTFNADTLVHQLIKKNGLAYPTLVEHFGRSILDDEQNIDRAKLRTLIFNCPEQKRWLEEYLHPLVRQELRENSKNATSSYTVIEIPLLTESLPHYTWLDRILVVDASEEAQQLRAYLRSGLAKNESARILAQQAPRQKRNSIAHDLIINHRDLVDLEHQVKVLHTKYLDLANPNFGSKREILNS